MRVTISGPAATAAVEIDLQTYWSIVLAVAQWRRNPYVTHAAVVRLRGFGIAEPEILARRRATSGDPRLAALLRIAVVIAITRGRLSQADRRFVERHSLGGVLALVEDYTADALAFVSAAGPPRRGARVEIDMNVGDY